MKILTTTKVFTAMMLYSTAGIATANVITNDINFSASNQSLFVAPFPSAAFEQEYNFSSASILGNTLLGYDIPTIAVKTKITADSGTVNNSTFNGVLAIEYQENQAAIGTSALSLDFSGMMSNFDSIFGIKAEVEAIFTAPNDGDSISLKENLGPLLEPNESYMAALDTQKIKASDDAVGVGPAKEGTMTVAGVEVDYKATLGAEMVVNQTTTLSNRVISGTITATHGSMGSTETNFSIDSSGISTVDMDLGFDGGWELSISEINFSSMMTHLFSVSPTITAGLELSNPFLNTDGGCGTFAAKCKGIREMNDKFSFKQPFGPFVPQQVAATSLSYSTSNVFDTFSINVGGNTNNPPNPPVPPVNPINPTAVPEPSTLAIFTLGLMGLASRRFKKKS